MLPRKRLTIEQFKSKATEIHKNIYDYSKAIYKNIDTKLIIICKQHGEFNQTPYHHVNRGQGCPTCSNINKSNKGGYRELKIPLEIRRMPNDYNKWLLYFNYNKETGELTNKFTNSKGNINSKGYIVHVISSLKTRKSLVAHRIIWEIMTKNKPTLVIDHINHDKQDNRFDNLRHVSQKVNSRNRSLPSNNKTNILGVSVSYVPIYTAYVTINGKYKELGKYADSREAKQVVKSYRKQSGVFHANHGKIT